MPVLRPAGDRPRGGDAAGRDPRGRGGHGGDPRGRLLPELICRIPRSTIEMAINGKLDFVDGMMFPSICDVIRT